MSIRYKLTLTMLGISIAAVLLTAFSITAYLVYDMRIGKVAELGVSAALTADRNSAALLFLDNARADKNLELFHLNPSMLVACVYDSAGKLFATYLAQGGTPHTGCPASPGAAPPTSHGMLTALKDIRQNEEKIGSVFLASDTREIDAYMHKSLLISGSAATLVFCITLLLTYYFQRALSRPILELTATAQNITAHGDYTAQARENYHDETGVLARAFNAMLLEVRKRDEELTRANETLEQKVSIRTRQMEEAKLKAEAASEAKSEFLRNMSHEFRTPLHALISFSAYGIKEHDSAERFQLKQYFELMQKGAERLSRLINEVLDLAKLEHGEHVLECKAAEMRDLSTRCAEQVAALLMEKNVTLTLEGDASVPAVCDQDKIMQVITNLLGNAIKFTPAGKRITLRARALEAPKRAEVTVIDEGIGIPEGETEAIFESFRQSSRTNTGAGGTGLGLAICRRIIGAHNGSIWAENNTGAPGARVTFIIPALAAEGRHTTHTQSMGEAA